MVALDGPRIAIRKSELKSSYSPGKVIIPGKTLKEVSSILSDDTEKEVTIYFTDKHIVFEFDKNIIVSRLIEGEYYNIDQMLSSEYDTKLTINRKSLEEALNPAMVLIKEGDKKPIIIDVLENETKIMMKSGRGEGNTTIETKKEGKEITIGFNPKFVMDVLKAVDEEEIDMFMVNPKAPCFIRDVDETYNYVILPINFSNM